MKSLNNAGAEASSRTQWATPQACSQTFGLVRAPAPEALGDELKTMFGALTAGPMPDRMMQLMDALEEAFHSGELFDPEHHRIS